jgi:hypothetical protein
VPSALGWPKAAGLAGLLAGLWCVWLAAAALEAKGDNIQAVPVWQKILAIREQQLGLEHPDTAASLNRLAFLYLALGRYGEAQTLFHRSLAIYGRVLGQGTPTLPAGSTTLPCCISLWPRPLPPNLCCNG